MINLTNNQIKYINELDALNNSRFMYNPDNWNELKPEYRELIQEFENLYISRNNIIDAFKFYFDNYKTENFIKPFLLTMVWGFANSGYGCYRVNNYLENEKNKELILDAITLIRKGNPDYLKTSFEKLNKINNLGISYVSKVLYFATRAKNDLNYALIFDIRVASALIKLFVPELIFQIVKINPSHKFSNYRNYIEIIHTNANKYGISAENLEMYLFNLDFNQE